MSLGPTPPTHGSAKPGGPSLAPDAPTTDTPLEPPASVRPLSHRIESWAWLLPAVGAVLLASPLIRAFAVDVRLVGAPIIMIYIFVVWFVLIIAAVALARLDAKAEAGDRRDRDSDRADTARPASDEAAP